MTGSSRNVAARYALFQIPELLLVIIGLVLLTMFDVVSEPIAWWLLAAWCLKEVVLYPFVKRAYEPSEPSATGHLLGTDAIVTERLAPAGRVRIGPETWTARLPVEEIPAEVGERVCVKSVEGLTLHVARS